MKKIYLAIFTFVILGVFLLNFNKININTSILNNKIPREIGSRPIKIKEIQVEKIKFNDGLYQENAYEKPPQNIFIGGYFKSYNGEVNNQIVVLNENGYVNYDFNTDNGFGESPSAVIKKILKTEEGKIILTKAGSSIYRNYSSHSPNKEHIIRLNMDGSKDDSFNSNSLEGGIAYPTDAVIQEDNKIIMVGGFTWVKESDFKYNIIRINTDGSTDQTFDLGGGEGFGLGGSVFQTLKMALQPDGKILVGGDINSYNGQPVNKLIRLNTDGSIDNTFNIGLFTMGGYPKKILLQDDGKILVAGTFYEYESQTVGYIIRFNQDGTKDSSFGIGFGNQINDMLLQPDGKILIGGDFTFCFNLSDLLPTYANRIIRIDQNSSIDKTFKTSKDTIANTGLNGSVKILSYQKNGDIIVYGNFTKYSATDVSNLIRLNKNGSFDMDFKQFVALDGFSLDITAISSF